MLDLEPSQWVVWCRQVIHHAANKAIIKKKKSSFREVLLINQPLGDRDEEWGDALYSSRNMEDFDEVEWRMLITVLSKAQVQVFTLSFVYGFTQQEIARRLHISQQQVSRIRKNAMKILWRQLRDVYAG